MATPLEDKVTLQVSHEHLFPFQQLDPDAAAALATQQELAIGLHKDTGESLVEAMAQATSLLDSEVHVVVRLVRVGHAAENIIIRREVQVNSFPVQDGFLFSASV